MSLNSRQRRQADERRAKSAVYRSHGKGPNPFEEGTRIYRMWERWRVFYLNMESQLREMEAAYGPMNAKPRYPQN
jgi:hypothetical protein